MTRVARPATALRDFDPGAVTERLVAGIRQSVAELQRAGAVVAVSGGVGSAVVAALCARALEPRRVLLLRLPEERDGDRSALLGLELAARLGTATREQSIGAALEALGCYDQQDSAVQAVFPDYQRGWPLTLAASRSNGLPATLCMVLERPEGRRESRRVPAEVHRVLLAAAHTRQRVRTLISYTWADRLHAVVAGAQDLLDHDQGYFVKGGDGLADVQPLVGLHRQQVAALGRYLQLPEAILARHLRPEPLGLHLSPEVLALGLPKDDVDLLLWGERQGVAPADLAGMTRMTPAEVSTGYAEVARRRTAAAYLHAPPVLLDATGAVP